MASSSCGPAIPPYPQMLYFPAPERVSSGPSRQVNDVDIMDVDSEQALDGEALTDGGSPFSSDSDSELSPKMVNRSSRRKITSVAHRISCEPTLARRRLGVGHRMSPATYLNSQVASRVVRYARELINRNDGDMGCLNCGLLPLCPITGECGHTRCSLCVLNANHCPCGIDSLIRPHVNILIRDLIGNVRTEERPVQNSRTMPVPTCMSQDMDEPMESPADAAIKIQPQSSASGSCRGHIRLSRRARAGIPDLGGRKRIPMTPLARYNHALDLLRLGRDREAVPYLALAAASGQRDLRQARGLLAQAIAVLSNHRDPRRLTTQLTRSVRRLSSTSWFKPSDMECILCCNIFTNPVTTPCGHMFCRTCLERTLDYGSRCPLCLRNLFGLMVSEIENTMFVEAALKSIHANVSPPPLEPDLIPIFVCTVAYPSVPCPLFIFDPRYWLMIRRVLDSGSRTFGMVACDRDRDYVDYGTILEVRDCVHLEDGRSILSTIGLSRFKVIERGVRDGCNVARILPITDVIPSDVYKIWDSKMLAKRIMCKALLWLGRLNAKVLADIEAAFGALQSRRVVDDPLWEGTDGPSWLWWLVAVLPLHLEIKVLILSTNCLHKRLLAVARTLEAVEQDVPDTTRPEI